MSTAAPWSDCRDESTAVMPVQWAEGIRPSPSMAAHRRQMGLSQEALANRLRVSYSTVSRWESRIRRPAHALTFALAEALCVPQSQVEAWFSDIPPSPGDCVGRVPGLKYVMEDRGVSLQSVARVCGVEDEVAQGWVYGRRSLPRRHIASIADLVGEGRKELLLLIRRVPPPRDQSPLRRLRIARGISLRRLSLLTGVGPTTVTAWERGRWQPPLERVHRLAEALDVTPVELAEILGIRHSSLGNGGEGLPHVMSSLQEARVRAGLNKAQLARCLGVTGGTISRWEAGLTRPTGVRLQRLIAVLPNAFAEQPVGRLPR